MRIACFRVLMALICGLFVRPIAAQADFDDPDAFIRFGDKAWVLSEFRAIDTGPGIVVSAEWLNDDLIFLRKKNTELNAKTAPYLVGDAKQPSNLRESFSVYNRVTRKSVEIATLASGQMFTGAQTNKSGTIVAITFAFDPNFDSTGVIFGNSRRGGSLMRIENPGEFVTPLISNSSDIVGALIGKGSVSSGFEQDLFSINPETNQMVKFNGPSLKNQMFAFGVVDPASGDWMLDFRGVLGTEGLSVRWNPARPGFSPVDRDFIIEASRKILERQGESSFGATTDLSGNGAIFSLQFLEGPGSKEKDVPAKLAKVSSIEIAPNLPNGVVVQRGQAFWFEIVPVELKVMLDASESVARKLALQQAKICGLGLMLYAADNDDMLPEASGAREAIAPYIKDSSIASRLVLTYSGGSLDKIENPSQTQLGYVEGPGGRAMIYADGHVLWLPD